MRVLLLLALAGCAPPLGALHGEATRARDEICAAQVRGAQWAWQRVARMRAGLPADPELVPGMAVPVEDAPPTSPKAARAAAVSKETMARRVCAQRGIR